MKRKGTNSKLVTIILLCLLACVSPTVAAATTIIIAVKWAYEYGKESKQD